MEYPLLAPSHSSSSSSSSDPPADSWPRVRSTLTKEMAPLDLMPHAVNPGCGTGATPSRTTSTYSYRSQVRRRRGHLQRLLRRRRPLSRRSVVLECWTSTAIAKTRVADFASYFPIEAHIIRLDRRRRIPRGDGDGAAYAVVPVHHLSGSHPLVELLGRNLHATHIFSRRCDICLR